MEAGLMKHELETSNHGVLTLGTTASLAHVNQLYVCYLVQLNKRLIE